MRSRFRLWLRRRTRWKRISKLTAEFGWWGAVKLRRAREPGSVFGIHPRLSKHPLFVRSGTSDPEVLDQIFIQSEYQSLNDLTQVGLIIDCGANVGYSSAYFLSHFPNCRIVAVEPDPENFAMLSRNLAPYGSRVNLMHAAVWSHATRLALVDDPYRDGREWTKQVRLAEHDDKEHIDGVDIGSLLLSSGQDRISILKVDVEGAEAEIFSGNDLSWLNKVDAIAIELHDDSVFGNATEVFFTAIEGHGFHLSRSGELTICRRRA